MNKQKAVIQLQTQIEFTKKKIDEFNKESRHTDKVFYQGMLQAYENIQSLLIEQVEEFERYQKYVMYFAGKDKVNDIRLAMKDRELD